MRQADFAEEIARKLLEIPLPRRWEHTQGVAARARSLAPILGDDADLLEAAAWLHDVGYSPEIADTGFHPMDGARYLRDVWHADETLCRLVANHSRAIVEAEQRRIADELRREFPPADPALDDALIYCDMTTAPDGQPVSVHDRLSEIARRYGPNDLVTHVTIRARPQLVSSVMRISDRLCMAAVR